MKSPSVLEHATIARKSLRDASRRQETDREDCRSKLIDAALLLLGSDDKLMQREAAVVLCGHDIGREPQEWEKILGRAMISFSSLACTVHFVEVVKPCDMAFVVSDPSE